MTAAVIVVGVAVWIGCGYVGAQAFPVQFPTLSKYADGSPSADTYAVCILNGPLSLILGWPDWVDGLRQRFFDESEDEDESNDGTLRRATSTGVQVSHDGGKTWQSANSSFHVPTKNYTMSFKTAGSFSADLSEVEPRESSDPLVGFRQWRLFEMEDGRVALVSSIRPYVYDGPVATTEREDLENGYGLHAAKDGDKFYDPAAHLPVEGEVELFGRVVEGSRGYRAEKLKIKSLTLYPGGWREAATKTATTWNGQPVFHTNHKCPDLAVRQFASSTKTETPWPHPFESLASRLEDRYRCDVEIGEREGSPIVDAKRAASRQLKQTNYHFIQKPTDSEVAEYSTGGEIWTPRDRDESADNEEVIGYFMGKPVTKKKALKMKDPNGRFMFPTGTLKSSFNFGGS